MRDASNVALYGYAAEVDNHMVPRASSILYHLFLFNLSSSLSGEHWPGGSQDKHPHLNREGCRRHREELLLQRSLPPKSFDLFNCWLSIWWTQVEMWLRHCLWFEEQRTVEESCFQWAIPLGQQLELKEGTTSSGSESRPAKQVKKQTRRWHHSFRLVSNTWLAVPYGAL